MGYQAAGELESTAIRYANEAIRLDSQGSYPQAVTMYQKAISTLMKLVQLYPRYELNQIYSERAIAYQERIRAIQEARGV
ncbi:MAG: AAA family ATPase, partial [Nitrososphaerota archaeon]|nr:AAA family ATPase [Nitrososphaerota archaeon]